MYLPQFMGNLNTHNMNTPLGTVLRTSSPRIWNYADSDGETEAGGNFRISLAAPPQIRTAQVITQEKLHDCCNVPSDWFNVYFRLWHGSPTPGIKQLVMHITLCCSTCDPQKEVWIFAIKTFNTLGSLRHVSFDINLSYQFITPHSILNDKGKGSNKTCENNIIPPTNIQYIKIHVRN